MTLAYRDQGAADGLTLLFIHPLGADQTFWDACRERFGAGIRTVSCDLRGSGASPHLTEPLSTDRAVDDIEDLRRHLGLERIVLVGCAVGAMAGAAYTARHADRVAALVMANPGFRITPEGAANLRERADLVRRHGMQALLPGAIDNAFIGYTDTARRDQYEQRFSAQSPRNYAFAALGAAEADLTDASAAIACPVLLVPGGSDRLFGMAHADELASRIKQVRVVLFEDGAHFIPYQQPERFAAVVEEFLKELQLLSPVSEQEA